jgi:hypothetical protein
MSGNCDGPMAALFSLLSNHGVLPEVTATLSPAVARTVAHVASEKTVRLLEPPDAPPPRA